MSLLPTASDVKCTIARLSCEDIVRIYTQSNGGISYHSKEGALRFLENHTWEVLQIDQKSIIMQNAAGSKYTFTFHRQIFTQIGIEALS